MKLCWFEKQKGDSRASLSEWMAERQGRARSLRVLWAAFKIFGFFQSRMGSHGELASVKRQGPPFTLCPF
jgi:hypothetical protein